MSMSPRPDQRAVSPGAGPAGSRSGSGDLAGALGYPGVPAAVPNCTGVAKSQLHVGDSGTLVTFPNPARVWLVILSYTIASDSTFTGPTVKTVTQVKATTTVPLVLATIQLSVAGTGQHDSGTVSVPYPGLPMTQGETLSISINNGTLVTGLGQEASVSVLYSIP